GGVDRRPGGGLADDDGDLVQGGVESEFTAGAVRGRRVEPERQGAQALADGDQRHGDDGAVRRQGGERLQARIGLVEGGGRREGDHLVVVQGVVPRQGV